MVAAGAAGMEVGRLEHRPDPQRRLDRARQYGRPKISALPALGFVSPSSIRSVVVLPAPFGPRKPVIVPGRERERERVDREYRPKPLRQRIRDHRRWSGSLTEVIVGQGVEWRHPISPYSGPGVGLRVSAGRQRNPDIRCRSRAGDQPRNAVMRIETRTPGIWAPSLAT